MRCAVVNANGVVENIIVADPQVDTAPESTVLIGLEDAAFVSIGFVHDGQSFSDQTSLPSPAVVVPDSVTPRQVRLLLLSQNLLSQVEAIIAASDAATKITWGFASEFRRNDPLLTALASQLGLTDEQVDQFFIAAAQL